MQSTFQQSGDEITKLVLDLWSTVSDILNGTHDTSHVGDEVAFQAFEHSVSCSRVPYSKEEGQ